MLYERCVCMLTNQFLEIIKSNLFKVQIDDFFTVYPRKSLIHLNSNIQFIYLMSKRMVMN